MKLKPLFFALITTSYAVVYTAWAEDDFEHSYFMESRPEKRLRITIKETIHAPNLVVQEWGVMAACPPNFDGQNISTATLTLNGVQQATANVERESSTLRQNVLMARLPMKTPAKGNAVSAQAVYEATLMSRSLKEGKPEHPPVIESALKLVYTSPTAEYDFKDQRFVDWLQRNGLHKRDKETDLAIGYRVLKSVVTEVKYKEIWGIEKASTICTRGYAACGGFSNLYVAILRANGVPARVLYGRIAKNSTRDTDPATFHCQAEFFAESVGWVPVDVAAATGTKDVRKYFGSVPGDLLVMHFDTIIRGEERTALQSFWFGCGKSTGSWNGFERTDELLVEGK